VKQSLTILLCLLLTLAVGCKPGGHPSTTDNQHSKASATSLQWSDELFAFAVNNLNRLEEFDSAEVLKQIVVRMQAISKTRQLPPEQRLDSLQATWPDPDMLRQIVGRLNQWAEGQTPPAEKLEPLLATLPGTLAAIPMLRDWEKMRFTSYDGFALQEVVWLRDISNWARGAKADELERARRIFDWTVRNIQLDLDSNRRTPQVPWETLLLGHGTGLERAWVFILLLRQQGIDAALLALPTPAPGGKAAKPSAGAKTPPAEGQLRPWCVGALIGEKGREKVYLFDAALGLPIPAPQGIRRAGGQLEIVPASLDQVAADRSLLARLDLEQEPYWAKDADLKQLVVLVEASPVYLAKRTRLLESHLVGPQKMVLSVAASEQGARFKAAAHAHDVRLWTLPYQTLYRRLMLDTSGIAARLELLVPFYAQESNPLVIGRVRHLKGRFLDSEGAIDVYQASRISNQELSDLYHSRAAECQKMVEQRAGKLTAEQRADIKQTSQEVARRSVVPYAIAKVDASYWLGLIAFEQGNYPAAMDYFSKRTLEATPGGPWTAGAHYNLGRTYEAAGQPQKAADEYQGSVFSRLDYGNLLRAKWLKQKGD
jgi:tetratricopeptide (TPR) repeat protein